MEDPEIYSPYYQSGLRPRLTMGCDRMLFCYSLIGVMAVNAVAFANAGTSRLTLIVSALSLLIFSCLVKIYRRMAREDSFLVKVYLRNRTYADHYRAE
jgi:type IV secretory pathway TrbD component